MTCGDGRPRACAGSAGADGRDGRDGLVGLNGRDGLVGLNGRDGATGPAGPQGDVGPAGEAGAKGDTGESGVLSGVTSERLAALEAQVNLNLSTTMEFATGLQTQLASQGDDINYLKNLSDLTEEALRNLQDSFWDEIDNRNQLIQDVRSVLYSHTAELQNLHENIGSLWAEINLLWSLLFSPSGPN